MSVVNTRRLVLDLGSRSAKAYLCSDSASEIAQVTWNVIGSEPDVERIKEVIGELTKLVDSHIEIEAFGTEAMRRNPHLARMVETACKDLQISYRTISQNEEAALIKTAVGDLKDFNIVNVGGGSIQVVSQRTGQLKLFSFGISDLNMKFRLLGQPQERQTRDCIRWLEEKMANLIDPFVYTGGEAHYLKHFGIQIRNGECLADESRKFANEISSTHLEDLEKKSPRDERWMHGAVASNCIVVALLNVCGADSFVPSDVNMGHGVVHQIGKKR